MSTSQFPFSAVVGQDDVKLALLLNGVDPAVGGVLLRGHKGSAKSTLARALAALLPGDAPFVELPVGATEDRVVGTVDITAALTTGEQRFRPGLLAAAHDGVLYVDEVNLLPDHLVDVLLDVAAGGVNRVEREGVSVSHPSRFVLIGSMNPEEGELRPQLLDRFGLAVDVAADTDPGARADAVARRLDFDRDRDGFTARWAGAEAELRARLAAARPARLPQPLLRTVSALCASVGAEGLRADLTICRAASALAGWKGRDEATVDDVRRVAPLALAHRARRSPLDDHGVDQQRIDDALDGAVHESLDEGLDEDAPSPDGESPPGGPGDRTAAPGKAAPVVPIAASRDTVLRSEAGGRRTTVEGPRGRLVGDRVPDGVPTSIAVGATARAAAARRAAADHPMGDALVEATDVREAVRQQKVGNLVVLAVDASGSMGAERRMEAAKGAVLGLLVDAYQRRDRVALVTFRDESADVVLRPTGSVEVARARLAELPTGGRTPLAAGILRAAEVAAGVGRDAVHQPLIVLVTDGRATNGPPGVDPLDAALDAAASVRRRGVAAVVVDAEDGPVRLGLARRVADAMGARHLTVPELTAGALVAAARSGG